MHTQALNLPDQQPGHPLLKLFGPPRSFDGPAQPADEQAAAAVEGQPLVIVELTLVGQEGGRHPHLWSLLDSLSRQLGSTGHTSASSSGLWQPAAAEATSAGMAAGEAADDSRWSVAAHVANAEEYLQSLLPPRQPAQPSWQPSQPRQQRHSHTHSHARSHRHHSWVQDGVALPARPPPSPLKLAALDTLFLAATLVALVCASLLAADIWRNGLWPPQQGLAGSSCRGCPAGALVALGQPEQQGPLLVVVAADEAAAAQQAGYSPL